MASTADVMAKTSGSGGVGVDGIGSGGAGSGVVGSGRTAGTGSGVVGSSGTGVDADTVSGLEARLSAAGDVLAAVVAELDPGCLTGADAKALYAAFAGFERLSVTGKTLLAPRINESGIWRETGHRDAATMLAALEGVSGGQARNTLTVGQRLGELPGTEEVARKGTLSGAKLLELTGAAVLDPAAESKLLKGAESESLDKVKERCDRSRATSAANDPMATTKRIRASRYFRWWKDAEGAFCYQGRDAADRGAQIRTHMDHVTNQLRRARRSNRANAEQANENDENDQSIRALQADAFYALMTREQIDLGGGKAAIVGTAGTAGTAGTDPKDDGADLDRLPSLTRSSGAPERFRSAGSLEANSSDPPGLVDRGAAVDPDLDPGIDPDTLAGDDSDPDAGDEPSDDSLLIIDRPPTCSVMVRVDLDALLRGRALPGEICEIDGQGPIPLGMARDMANDSFLRLCFHRAGRIQAISHMHRTINMKLRTALVYRDRNCVVPGCSVAFGLEIDHVIPFNEGGPTELDNLALLCHHHHKLKSESGWTLERTGIDDQGSPTWRFDPQPPFGQEPDLGIDTPDGRKQWRSRLE